MKQLLTLLATLLFAASTLAQPTKPTPPNVTARVTNDVFGPIYTASTNGILTASAEIQRTNTVTAYILGDVISTNEGAATCYPLCFTNVLGPNGSGIVILARVTSDQNTDAWPAQIYFYSNTNITFQTDNLGFGPVYANNASRLGYVDIPNLSKQTGAGTDFASGLNSMCRLSVSVGTTCAATNNYSLFGYLVVGAGFTPKASGKYSVMINVLPK